MKLILITGKARSGKTTSADIFVEILGEKSLKLSYGYYLKEYAKRIVNWNGDDNLKPRDFLQELGTKIRKKNPDIFVKRMLEDIDVYDDYFDYIIINDKTIDDLQKKNICYSKGDIKVNIKDLFIDYFVKHGHKQIPSAPVVPENDPTVLFNTAGMQPLIPYLMGEKHPYGTRLCDYQKCVRTNDLDEVGDKTHHTFFCMSNGSSN